MVNLQNRSIDCRLTNRARPFSFWLTLVVYPTLNALGTYPVVVGGGTISLEFFFSIVCVGIFLAELAIGHLRLSIGNFGFWLGLLIWIAATLVSAVVNSNDDAAIMLVRMLLKLSWGYMIFVILVGSGGWRTLLHCYLLGCALAGLCGVAYWINVGNLEEIRQASYGGLDPDVMDINLFRGLARMGVGNLLPFWIATVLFIGENGRVKRVLLAISIPFFATLALLALRREVLVEAVVGVCVLVIYVPRSYRRFVLSVALSIAAIGVIFVSQSERWQERLFGETREQFETTTDPRTVLLINTPTEVQQSPWIGFGPGSYPKRMAKYLPQLAGVKENGIAPHNSFSRAAVESGWLGFCGFTLMIISLGGRSYFSRKRSLRNGNILRLTSVMIFLHVMDWLFFGDGIASNVTWFFIGAVLYLDHCTRYMDRMQSGELPVTKQIRRTAQIYA